jgi:tetratricopeptide (TPR) repeat protein
LREVAVDAGIGALRYISMITRQLRQPGIALFGALTLFLFAFSLFGLSLTGLAQRALADASQDQGESSSKRDSGPLPKDSSVKPDPDGRLAADKDIDVGIFYAHKGDPDAAIGRYQDAADVAPKYPKPRLLLAEAFEKKGERTAAVKYYKQYLAVDPNAPDKQKIEKKIEKLGGR